MKKINLIALVLILSATCSFAQTIYSTEIGGQWEIPTTWIGGVVPTSGNDVVINGTVVVLNLDNKCKNLVINANKFLGGTTGYYGQLTVYENITNNGGIGGGASFDIHGDIINNGNWGNPQFNINLKGSDQTITCADNSPIGSRISATDSTTNVYLGSDLKLIIDGDNSCVMGDAELFTQGHNLTIEEGHLQNVRITTSDTLTFINTILSSVIVKGNYALKGLIYAFQNNVFKGTATNLEGIINVPGYSTILAFEGDFINYGSIQHSEVHIYQNLTNYGTWYNQVTRFMGSNEKVIINSGGHPFDGVQIVIANPDAVVKFGSDTEISPDHFFLGDGILDCNNHYMIANTVFHNGKIINAAGINLHGFYENVTLEGQAHLYGTNNMMYVTLSGTFFNHDTITAAFPQAGNVLQVFGHFINEGDYYNLYMDLKGDLTNHGEVFNNSLMNVKGEVNQFINISNHINSEVRFLAMMTGTAYQWMKNGEDMSGQQSDMLIFNTLELSDAGIYQCRVTVGGNPVYSREIAVNLISGMNEKNDLVSVAPALYQNYPNPFNNRTIIRWNATEDGMQTIKVFDMLGKEVAILVDEYRPAGSYEVEFDVDEVQNTPINQNIFFYSLKTGEKHLTKKMVMAR